MIKRLLCSITLNICFTASALAELVNPVLYGWYTNAIKDYQDSCLETHFIYENLETRHADEIATELLTPRTQINNCKWTNISVTPDDQWKPPDFPGSNEAWNLLRQQNENITHRWARKCINEDGIVLKTLSVVLYPSYRCPTGSHPGLDRQSAKPGCTTTPSGCYGDVVGRSLNTEHGGSLGHVAVTAGHHVIEVMNDEVVVQENSLDDFRKISEFWGERYPRSHQHESLTFEEGAKISQIASGQKQCDPSYTAGWTFQPCADGKRAQFRCDSFVYYSFLAGANIDLGFTRLVTVPSSLFMSIPHCRFCPDTLLKEHMIYKSDISHEVQNSLDIALGEEPLDIQKLDVVTRELVYSNELSRENKIDIFMNALEVHKADSFRFKYLADIFTELEPIEVASELIRRFHENHKPYIQQEYLALLTDSVANPDRNQFMDELSKIKIFLDELIKSPSSDSILSFTFIYYPEVLMDEVTYQSLIHSVQSFRHQSPVLYKKIMRNSNFWYHMLGMTTKHQRMNLEHLESLLALSQNEPKEIQSAFKQALQSRKQKDKHFIVPRAIQQKLQLERDAELERLMKMAKKAADF